MTRITDIFDKTAEKERKRSLLRADKLKEYLNLPPSEITRDHILALRRAGLTDIADSLLRTYASWRDIQRSKQKTGRLNW